MPPPNSASHGTPTLSPTTPAPEPLSRRSSIPNSPILAESENAHDENVNFLRSRALLYNPLLPSLSRHRRRRYQTSHPFPMEDEDRMELDDPNDLRLSVELNRRIPIIRRHRDDPGDMPNYDGRRSTSRSSYGWAPGSDNEDEDRRGDDSDDDQVQPFLHAAPYRSASSNRPRRMLPPPAPRTTEPHTPSLPRDFYGRNQSEDYGPLEPPNRWVGTPSDDESRSTTRSRIVDNVSLPAMESLLQSARRNPRLARTRTLENYLLDRHSNRSNDESDEADRTRGFSSRGLRFRPTRGDSHRHLTHSELRARAATHRQLHSATPGDSLLKDTIGYLDRLRYSGSLEESINSAAATGVISLEGFSWKDSDFILDTNTITPPAPCSWLRPGVVFSGCQRAANTGSTVLSRRVPSPHAPSDPVIVNGSDSTRINVITTNGRQYLANARDENWPVKVTIHNINYSDMTLSGTMEAYNIPDKTSPTHDAHIVTFLEGEIIDFNKHTLETKNFKADADIDSTYWRELQPFKDLPDSEIARKLVSRKWVTEELAKRWILMRWKERCFITPTDSRQGLTISGFYYISLRRDDGHIDGLYYDPGSSPYQQLSLQPEMAKMIRPSYTFR
ncbi:hypothetical protein N7462_007155 [Penicillium macrosclerotiorum]|uniref:uncharacterized protein n=1 Tax=Penicillium macrosclerotiorum TaxID=303699 RepID=UPI0025470A76|nr:uncharacterized protein N7462_007155 [Penicillium macrosclerotiorum]KAJ5678911.1 hypothetical protein N7462_007155 [Penicillium macrosclerotiorum]